MQRDKEGRSNIVSTVSRVLTPAEQKYTTCELKLLAIVNAFANLGLTLTVIRLR